MELALAFGGDRIVYGTKEKDYGWPVENAMPFVAVREGRAGIYSEAGSGGAGVPEEPYVNYFVTGILNILKVMGVMDGEVVEQGEQLVVDPLAVNDQTVQASMVGIFNPYIRVGETVKEGQVLAEIHGIPQGMEQITAPIAGLITYLQLFGPTAIGDRLLVISPVNF